MYEKLKEIEVELEGEEYTDGGISFYFGCDLIPTTESIKEILIKNKVLGKDDNVELVNIEECVSDFESISGEWHFSEQMKKRFLDILEKADAYYGITADGSYASWGYSWSTCRVIKKDDQLVLLEFYITD